MDGNSLFFIPTFMWSTAVSVGIAILLLACIVLYYCNQRIKAVTGDTADCATLAAKKERLEADVHALEEWIAVNRNDLLQMEAERKQQEEIRLELEGLQDGLSDLRHEKNQLESDKEILHSVVQSLRNERAQHEQRKSELNVLQNELIRVQSKLQQGNAQLAACAGAEIKHRRLTLLQILLEEQLKKAAVEKENAEKIVQESNSKLGKLRIKMQYYEEKEEHCKQLESTCMTLKLSVDNLEKQRSDIGDAIKKLEDTRKKIQKDLDSLNAQSTAAQASVQVKQGTLLMLDEKRKEQNLQIQEMDAALRSKEAEYATLEEKIRDQRAALGLTTEEPEGAYADLVDVRPECLNDLDHARAGKLNEADMLKKLCAALAGGGHYFSQRVINAFHTSLKCQTVNPLTVLAGVSGTGKTLLPNKYADFMGIHKLVMAVQPRWDSPQDLFGFYNYLEKKYKAKDLARLLVHMDPYNEHALKDRRTDMQDRLALVLLDEMNLARTEYYFSEFLSRLELRQLVDADNRHTAELELDTGPGASRRIWVPENVFFVGTMNEDESTQTLSDKVLDRSNVLRFGKPDAPTEEQHNSNERDGHVKANEYLSRRTWESWYRKPDSDVYKEVTGWINTLNAAMNTIGRPFGFRVQNAMQTYVANYPDMGRDNRHKLAFADQIEQKILPKLRGLDMEGLGLDVLQTVQELIGQMNDEDLYEAFDHAQRETSTGMFQWRGVTRAVSTEL